MEAYLQDTCLVAFAIASFAMWSKAAADNAVEIESEHEVTWYGEFFVERWHSNYVICRFACRNGSKWSEFYGGVNNIGLPRDWWWQREACQDFCRKLNEREEV